MDHEPTLSRRAMLGAMAATGAALVFRPHAAPAQAAPITKAIPSSGERLPVVGLGSWITFNVGDDPELREECVAVMRAFFAAGGRMIDSSPMYGSSQQVIGYGLARLGRPQALFSADKVWISSGSRGPEQIEQSRANWGVRRFDLLQVHNLVAWEDHLRTLFAMKAEGRVRYVGITTSEGRRHDEMAAVMASRPIDFVQVTYNPLDREVEERILPLARDRGIAVIANRPFRQGTLIREVQRHPLPSWAADIGAVPVSWCLVTGATLWAMGSPDAWIPPLAAFLVLVAFAWAPGSSRRSGRRRGTSSMAVEHQ